MQLIHSFTIWIHAVRAGTVRLVESCSLLHPQNGDQVGNHLECCAGTSFFALDHDEFHIMVEIYRLARERASPNLLVDYDLHLH